MQTLTKVQYLRRVRSPRSMVGRPGEIKTLAEQEANQLVCGGYAQIIEAGIPLAPPEVEDPPWRKEEPVAEPKPRKRTGAKPKPTGAGSKTDGHDA